MRLAAGIVVLLVALGGVALSTLAGLESTCVQALAADDDPGGCGSWQLVSWWGMWASAGLFVAAAAALALAWRSSRRALWVLAALVAVAAVLPLPVDLWQDNELRRTIEDLVATPPRDW